MNDYDVFVVPSFTLDTNYNYDIKLVTSKEVNKQILDKFEELGITEDIYFNSISKNLYYISLSCLIDLRKWLLHLDNEFKLLGIRSNLTNELLKRVDNSLFNKTKEVKK